MSSIYEAKEEMHRLEAVLYPNHLTGAEGTYFARNTKEKTIDVEAICAAMKNRGGYEGSHDEAVKTVQHFLKETMYQLCDGFSVNLGWFTINVRFGGLFHSVKESFAPPTHKVAFSFHPLRPMKKLTELIEVTVSGHVEETAFISEFDDMEASNSGNHFEPGHVCVVTGSHLRIEGDPVYVGLWLVPVQDPTKRVKIPRIISNGASRIEFVAVATGYMENRIEIRTFYTGTPTPLKQPRTIASPFTITEV